jgi:hypothetical protein
MDRVVVDDLGRLLREASITGRYVLVAHSLCSAYIRSYASKFPRDIVGMTHEHQYAFASTGYVLPPMPPDQNPERYFEWDAGG